MEYPASKTTPWQHQIDFWNKAHDKQAFYAAHDMGCGKSKAAIDFANGIDARKILITCPKKVIQVWPHQFKLHSRNNYQVLPLINGSVREKEKQAKKFLEKNKFLGKRSVIVINYESFW